MGRMIDRSKLRASTLVEVIVAMVIISTVFILSLAVFVRIGRNANNSLKLRATMLSENVINTTRVSQTFYNEELDDQSLVIIKQAEPYKHYTNLMLISVTIKNKQGKILLVKNEIMINE